MVSSIAEERRGPRYNRDITPCSSAVSCSSRRGGAGLAVFDAGYHVDRHSEVELGAPRGDNYKSLTFTPTQTIACPRRVRCIVSFGRKQQSWSCCFVFVILDKLTPSVSRTHGVPSPPPSSRAKWMAPYESSSSSYRLLRRLY